MIKVIKPSPYNTVWYLDPGVPPDGSGSSFDDPIVWQLHSESNNTILNQVVTSGSTLYILTKLQAGVTYSYMIQAHLGPCAYDIYKKNDSSTIVASFEYYNSSSGTFTIPETGEYIIHSKGTFYNSGTEQLTITPAPDLISGETQWVRDKTRVQPGLWDANGVLNEFRDLGEAEIAYSTFPDVPKDGLWAYYPLIRNCNDVSGNKRHLNEFGSPVYSSANGVSGFSTTTYFNVAGFVSGTNPRSICMWFRFIGTNSNEMGMFCQGEENYGKNFALTRYNDDRLRAHTYGWSDGSYTLSGKNDLHHVVMTYEQGDSTKRLMYVDGQLVKEWSSSTDTSAVNMFFGIWSNGNTATGQYGFSGYMHDIALYNRAITAAEVLQVYNAGNSLK